MYFGNEAIDHQFSNFTKELKDEIHKLRTGKTYNNNVLMESNLSNIVETYTGLKVKFDSDGCFSTRLINIDKNNILLNRFKQFIHIFENEQAEYLILKKGMIDGTVNLQTGKVSGDFSEIIIKIYLPKVWVWNKDNKTLSDEEIVAILLHEIGHNITFLEALNRITTTNFIIADSTRKLLKAETKEQRIVILAKLEDFYGGISSVEIEQIAEKVRSEQAYTVLIMQMAVQQSYSQLNDNIYDISASERLADNYVTKFGYGVHIVTALDKLYRSSGTLFRDKAYDPPLLHYTFTIIKLIWGIHLTGTMLSPVGYQLFGTVGVTVYIILRFTPYFNNPNMVEYEPIQRRMDKVRLGLIDRLKEPNLPKNYKEELLNNIEIIDDLISKLYIYSDTVEFIWRYIYLKGKKQYTFIQNQLKLEEMLNNRLFQTNAMIDVHTSN